MTQAETMVERLFAAFIADPAWLPEEWREGFTTMAEADCAIHIGDFIAGMTDRYAIEMHRRLFDGAPDLL
jgi:dGTPase